MNNDDKGIFPKNDVVAKLPYSRSLRKTIRRSEQRCFNFSAAPYCNLCLINWNTGICLKPGRLYLRDRKEEGILNFISLLPLSIWVILSKIFFKLSYCPGLNKVLDDLPSLFSLDLKFL